VVVLPAGTVSFLFSDIEGSTRLLQQLGDAWGHVLSEHRRLLREAVTATEGREVDNQGDAFFFVFGRARDATAAAAAGQRALAEHDWPQQAEIRVRMGIHTGEPAVGDEGYLGIDVVRAARICSAAHGGQVLVSETTRALAADAEFVDLGRHRLKDIDAEQHLFQLVVPGLPSDFPPLQTPDLTPQGTSLAAARGTPERARRAADELAARIDADVQRMLADAGIPGYAPVGPGSAQTSERPSFLRRLLRGRQESGESSSSGKPSG
jgi:class 3 adenylate cyclase